MRARRPFATARAIGAALLALLGLFGALDRGALAQTPARSATPARAGVFDYYVLALSWSPTYCADPRAAARDQAQCGSARRYAFVVHGLWPQNEVGWPQDCATAVREAPPALAQQQLDIMPSARLVQHEWRTHGACSGLTPQAYFDLTRRLRAAIATPPAYAAPDRPLLVTAADVRANFIAANPKLRADGLAIRCRNGRLQDVRVCFTKAGAPRTCGRDVRDRCDGRVQMPPVRAGAAPPATRR
ncbi:MAG: ribonuclease T2 [Alphaproteobacteria bacterium]|nr:ribonuclease T2 [Alphaproteobacteria bacterium]